MMHLCNCTITISAYLLPVLEPRGAHPAQLTSRVSFSGLASGAPLSSNRVLSRLRHTALQQILTPSISKVSE